MKVVLHVLTKRDDPLARRIVERHRHDPELCVKEADLTGSGTDYGQLLEEIFAADSIQVW